MVAPGSASLRSGEAATENEELGWPIVAAGRIRVRTESPYLPACPTHLKTYLAVSNTAAPAPTNGKVEIFDRTIADEWPYASRYTSDNYQPPT